jgi:hypothetical protein
VPERPIDVELMRHPTEHIVLVVMRSVPQASVHCLNRGYTNGIVKLPSAAALLTTDISTIIKHTSTEKFDINAVEKIVILPKPRFLPENYLVTQIREKEINIGFQL